MTDWLYKIYVLNGLLYLVLVFGTAVYSFFARPPHWLLLVIAGSALMFMLPVLAWVAYAAWRVL